MDGVIEGAMNRVTNRVGLGNERVDGWMDRTMAGAMYRAIDGVTNKAMNGAIDGHAWMANNFAAIAMAVIAVPDNIACY